VLADAEARREDVRESMASLRVLTESCSRATSHRPVRMSEASLPQWAEWLGLSVDRTQKWYS